MLSDKELKPKQHRCTCRALCRSDAKPMQCSVRTARQDKVGAKSFDDVFGTLIAQGISPDELFDIVCKQVCLYELPVSLLLWLTACDMAARCKHITYPQALSDLRVGTALHT